MKPSNPVLLAVIGAAQGLKGEVRVKSYCQEPEGFAQYGALYDKNGRAFDVMNTRVAKEVVVTRFKGINDRNAAEALNGTELFIERALLGNQLVADDEFLHADLIGLRVVDEQGNDHGIVTAIHNFGAGDILEAAKQGGHFVDIPFTKAAVPDINFATKIITVDSLAAGLVEDDDEDEPLDRPRGPKDAGGNR